MEPAIGGGAVPASNLSPKGRRTRQRILNAALELFATEGSNGVSLRAIAAHAGLSHPAILRYFANKDELVAAAIGLRDDSQMIDIRTMGRSHEAAAAVFRAVVELMGSNLESPGIVATYVRVSAEATDPDHPSHDYFVQRYQMVVAAASKVFARAFKAASPPRPVDADSAARQLIALMDGLQVQWLLDPDGTDVTGTLVDFFDRMGIDVGR